MLSPVQLIGDLAVVLAIFQYAFNRALLFYKIIVLVATAWSLHAREVLKTAVYQMKTAEHRTSQNHFLRHFQQQQQKKIFFISLKRPAMGAISAIWVNGFCRQHARLLVDLVALNGRFISPLLFANYQAVLVFSVYLLCLICFKSWSVLEKVYMLGVFLGMMSSFFCLFFWPLWFGRCTTAPTNNCTLCK